jgi:hypothetical protein
VEEALYTFSQPRDRVSTMTEIRTTLLVSSQQALKTRGHWSAYLERVPPAQRNDLLTLVVGAWVPIGLGMAHYEACEQLGLPHDELLAIGHDVELRLRKSILLAHVAREVGVTPVTVLLHAPRFWLRVFRGSEVALHRLGPKDARFAIAGAPFCRLTYNRVTFRGILEALVAPFCQRAFLREAPEASGPMAMGWRIAWV